jgi:hypothetical protein
MSKGLTLPWRFDPPTLLTKLTHYSLLITVNENYRFYTFIALYVRLLLSSPAIDNVYVVRLGLIVDGFDLALG